MLPNDDDLPCPVCGALEAEGQDHDAREHAAFASAERDLDELLEYRAFRRGAARVLGLEDEPS